MVDSVSPQALNRDETPLDEGADTPGNSAERSGSSSMLVASFLLAFFVAASAFVLVGHFGFNTPRSLSVSTVDNELAATEKEPVASFFTVHRAGVRKTVAAHDSLNPSEGTDYMVFVWFRLRRVPESGEYTAVLGKFDAKARNRPGLAISLEGAPDGVRPRVYWNNAAGEGRWYSFASRYLRRNGWYLLAVSFSQDTFLSAYLVDQAELESNPLVGAHRLGKRVDPSSSADLVVGALGSGDFRGDIGPFGILSAKGLHKDIQGYVARLAASPNHIASGIPADAVRLWASPEVDLGSFKHAVTTGAGRVKSVKPKKASSGKAKSRGKKGKKHKKPKQSQKSRT